MATAEFSKFAGILSAALVFYHTRKLNWGKCDLFVLIIANANKTTIISASSFKLKKEVLSPQDFYVFFLYYHL